MRKRIKAHPRITLSISLLIALTVLVLIGGYKLNWAWTGFAGDKESYKTLYDWLNLLGVLAIPVVVGFGAVWFTIRQGKVADAENTDNQRETALQKYIDVLSELLLHEKLRQSQPEEEVCKIARVRTLTVLPRLDANRKKSVLQFLYESGLIDKSKCIVDLSEADLSRANLSGAGLWGADLRGANLQEANLSGAKLSEPNLLRADLRADFRASLIKDGLWGADLRDANLRGANLQEANLSGSGLWGADLSGADLSRANLSGVSVTPELLDKAKSLKGATMPDGSIHP
jgi:hypothetical protein